MVAPKMTPPPLLGVIPENIPEALRALPRWAPWKAVWDEKRGKYDKRPWDHVAGYGRSIAKPHSWGSFDAAMAAYLAHPGVYAGVGILMVQGDGLVGVDMDKCVVEGQITGDAALDVASQLNSYREYSPSGKGGRAFVWSSITNDWTNHEMGLEVYAGHAPRFLTVTGHRMPGAPTTVSQVDPAVLVGLAAKYGRVRRENKVISLEVPELLDELALPSLSELELSDEVRGLMEQGPPAGADASAYLQRAGVELYSLGLDDATVLSVLASNGFCMEIALNHRRQDYDKALLYLWVEHCQKAKPKARTFSPSDFDDVRQEAQQAAAQEQQQVQQEVAQRATRFKPLRMVEYRAALPKQEWLIRGVLPRAELTAVYGSSGAGKSFFAISIAAAIARGVRWYGMSVRQGRVVYVVAEGAKGFALRVQAYEQHHGVDMSQTPFFAIPDAPSLMDRKDVAALATAIVEAGGADLIVIDTLSRTMAGHDENANDVMSKLVQHCQQLHRDTNATILIVGHSGKDESKGMRGSSVIKGALDAEIEVVRSGQARAATVTKQKDGEGEGREFGFRLDVVKLGEETDDDGEIHDITSCVLHEHSAKARPALPTPRGAHVRMVLGVVTDMVELAGPVEMENAVSAAAAQMVAPGPGERDQRRRNAKRAIEQLIESKHLRAVDDKLEVAE